MSIETQPSGTQAMALGFDWPEVHLEELIEDAIGGAWGDDPSKATGEQVIVRVLRGTEFRNWDRDKGSTAATRAIEVKSFARRMLSVGDMVVEISGGGPSQPVGRTLVIDKEAFAILGARAISSNFCRRVRFKANVNPFFVDQVLKLKYSLGELDQFQTETTNIRNLTFPKFIAETSIPLPEREVQDQIVEMIEGLQAQVGQARARLATIPALLKKFRQSVLAAACSGQLTSDWHSADNGNWESATIGKLYKLIDGDRGKNYPKESDYSSKGHCLFLSTKNVRPYGFEFNSMQFISKEKHEQLRGGTLQRGDAVITTRGTLGNVAVYDDKVPFNVVRVNSGMLILRPTGYAPMHSQFLKIFIASPAFTSQLSESFSGTAQPQLPARILHNFEIGIPSLAEQAEIVRRVESLFTLADSIESRLAEATTQVERTTQAILAKAFRGELLDN